MQPESHENIAKNKGPGQLTLNFGSYQFTLSPGGKQTIKIGRVDLNDIVIEDDSVSRRHAQIDLTESGYVLTNLGINGTCIQSDEGGEVFIRVDESAVLSGSGLIGIAHKRVEDAPLVIEYTQEMDPKAFK